ncbi:hypothetical protein SAMN05443572_1011347 [Myxococcus fulvus]|uniref:Uncharacterized protein n=1 Tax=Myxococcus fulvus TaxID=33 RepID=A0A511ST54_MYXFU|nr:hypothetical protein MFU01_01460 [Myxococcus fulvus]SET17786.1 hypothetical protein SAMN05443572_1011347 [Myxococcus fulvus]
MDEGGGGQFTIVGCDCDSFSYLLLTYSVPILFTVGPLLVWWLRRGARHSGYGLSSTSTR